MYCEVCEVLEREPIIVDDSWTYGCNKCIVCNKYYKHSRIWWGNDTGMYELREKISHPACAKLLNEIKKKKKELMELEDKLFEKKFLIFNGEAEVSD